MDAQPNPGIYAGEYLGFQDIFVLSVVPDGPAGSHDKLAVVFNHREASKRRLVFFRKNVCSFLPEDRNTWAVDLIPITDYRETLLEFELDGATQVTGLWWQWEKDEKPAWLRRV